ncbi:hypothetical protein H0H93_008877 [Arthromyces matolae]|nr:hypothetical protein H0H93_008877 [Arthromyces matolae]
MLRRRGSQSHPSSIFLLVVTTLMFLGGTLFLALDVTDLVRRMQIIMIDNPDETLQEKLDRANDQLKKTVWTGEMLFVFMLILGDSVVVWRTWTIFQGQRRWMIIPISTWLGSLTAGLYELGCDLHTHWAINDLTPSAASVGAAKLHRKLMSQYLGSARRKTAAEKVLTLLIESGFVYIVIYTLQAVPIYGANLSPAGLFAFNVVNAVIQQAMGMYPTVIIVLVRMHKSLWDTTEVSQSVYGTKMKFRTCTTATLQTAEETETAFSSHPESQPLEARSVAMVHLNPSQSRSQLDNDSHKIISHVVGS